MERGGVKPGRTEGAVVIGFRCRMTSLSHFGVSCPRTTISTVAMRLCFFHVWHGGMLALDEQGVRLYWCVRELEGVVGVRYTMSS